MTDLDKVNSPEELANVTPQPAGMEPAGSELHEVEATVGDAPLAEESVVMAELSVEVPEGEVSPEESEEAAVSEEEKAGGLNFHAMDKSQLLERMREILANNEMEAHKDVTAIKQAFYSLRNKEILDELNKFVDEGNSADAFAATPCEIENEIKELYAQFKERRALYIEEQDRIRKENLARKEEILAKMREIAGNIDTVNVKFQEFQQLQQEFRAIKDIPAESETEIWKAFQTVGEEFYDHLKMNKELRDLDFKRNLEAKRQLIENAVKLAEVADVVAAFRSLQGLHEEWRALGPVAKDLRDEIWEEFRAASAVVNRRHQEHFEKRKAEEQANEEAKTRICDEVEAIDLESLKTFSDWNKTTDRVIALQKEWKEYGYAPRKSNATLYSRFRKACDAFFEAKTAYFQRTKDELASNLEKKTALCEKVEALKETEDLQAAMAEVLKLQAEWKSIGSVPRRQSDAIWERFSTACNYFFDKRKQESKERNRRENANLEAKREVIAKIAALPLDGDRREVIGQLKELQDEWQQIGFVPFKMKDKVYGEYREAVDAVYNAYSARESNRRMSNFTERVNEMKGDSRQMGRERERLTRALEGRRQELHTIENNMGFFNVKSSAGSSLVKDMENKIKRLKEEIKEIQQKISLLRNDE